MEKIRKLFSLLLFFILLFFVDHFLLNTRVNLKDFTMVYYTDSQEELLKCKCEIRGGEKNGESICYDEQGELFLRENFVNDKRHGMHTVYFPSGKVHEIRNYSNDSLDGLSIDYYPNGVKHFIRYYRDGEYVYEKEFDKKGEILVSGIKVNVEKVGTENFEIGKETEIRIELDYSEYDTLFLVGFFDLNGDSIYEDSVFTKKDYLSYILKPKEPGEFELNGLIIEINGQNMLESGEGVFNYKYKVNSPPVGADL